MKKFVDWVDRWCEDHLGGHITLKLFGKRITIYGFNAMRVAINISPTRWGYVCFHPTVYSMGRWHPWYFYISPNSTPWAATFAIGPGIASDDRRQVAVRRVYLKHGYRTDDHSEEMDLIRELDDRIGLVRVRRWARQQREQANQ